MKKRIGQIWQIFTTVHVGVSSCKNIFVAGKKESSIEAIETKNLTKE